MKASDFMDSQVVVVRADDPVQVAVMQMIEQARLALPVVGQEGEVLGLVRQFDILRLILPAYLASFPDLSFIPEDLSAGGKTFEGICQIRVTELIDPEVLHLVDEDEPILEVVRLMLKHCLTDVAVTSGGRLVGMISSTRLLQRLAVCGSLDRPGS